jgi:hypothetical protein
MLLPFHVNINGKGGYNWYIHPNILNQNPVERIRCIKKALKTWTCATGINWQLAGVLSTDVIPPYNLIKMDALPYSVNMRTYPSREICGTDKKDFVVLQDFEIAINDTNSLTWYYDPDNITSRPLSLTLIDFYHDLLHELGHAHNLHHIIQMGVNATSLEHPVTPPNNHRVINPFQTDIDAGQLQMDFSTTQGFASCANEPQVFGAHQPISNLFDIGCNISVPNKVRVVGAVASHYCINTSPKPKISLIIRGGQKPFTVFWKPESGNQVTIDKIMGDTVTIEYFNNPNDTLQTARYKVWVIDNSGNKGRDIDSFNVVIKFRNTNPPVKLLIRDHIIDDGSEPSFNDNPYYVWNSIDLWNRNKDDNGTDHQDPESDSLNYLRVRVRNIGCANFDSSFGRATLKVYRTWRTSGEVWAQDWIDPAEGGELIDSIDLRLYPLASGKDTIIKFSWYVPTLTTEAFDSIVGYHHLCFLARIETDNVSEIKTCPDGGTFANGLCEKSSVKYNVVQNRKIATRNTAVIKRGNGVTLPPNTNDNSRFKSLVYQFISNPDYDTSFRMNLKFRQDFLDSDSFPNVLDYAKIHIELDSLLFAHWVTGGSVGTGFQQSSTLPHRFTITNTSTVNFGNITLPPNTKASAKVELVLDSTLAYVPSAHYAYWLIQEQLNSEGEVIEDRGGVHFSYDVVGWDSEFEFTSQKPPIEGLKNEEQNNIFRLYPNPTTNELTVAIQLAQQDYIAVELYDLSGRKIQDLIPLIKMPKGHFEKSISVSNLSAGFYICRVKTSSQTHHQRLLIVR